MAPIEYRKAQSGRNAGFNYLFNPANEANNLGLLVYPVSTNPLDPYQHNRWDIEVEAVPGSTNARVYVKPTRGIDVMTWLQGDMNIISRKEGQDEIITAFNFADFQAAPDHAILVADLSGDTRARKLKIVIVKEFTA
jgi:hypothetical protein